MSEFLSNFLTYSTASVFAGACFLVGADLSAPQGPEGDVEIISRAAENPAYLTDPLKFGGGAGGFDEAVLESVVFTTAGVDQTPQPVGIKRPTGTVTGASVNLREGPGTNYTIADRGRQGDSLQVTGKRDGIWFEVISINTGERVWIHGNFFSAPVDGSGAVLAQN